MALVGVDRNANGALVTADDVDRRGVAVGLHERAGSDAFLGLGLARYMRYGSSGALVQARVRRDRLVPDTVGREETSRDGLPQVPAVSRTAPGTGCARARRPEIPGLRRARATMIIRAEGRHGGG